MCNKYPRNAYKAQVTLVYQHIIYATDEEDARVKAAEIINMRLREDRPPYVDPNAIAIKPMFKTEKQMFEEGIMWP